MTLAQLAGALEVQHCRGSAQCPMRHAYGGSAEPGIVHLDREDPLRFLYLAAIALNPDLDADPAWVRVYRIAMFQRTWARMLRIRMPHGHQRHMKAFVLAGVGGLSNDIPLRKQAYDWARR